MFRIYVNLSSHFWDRLLYQKVSGLDKVLGLGQVSWKQSPCKPGDYTESGDRVEKCSPEEQGDAVGTAGVDPD